MNPVDSGRGGGGGVCGCASAAIWDLYCAAITAEWAVNLAARSTPAAEYQTARVRRDKAVAAWRTAVDALAGAVHTRDPRVRVAAAEPDDEPEWRSEMDETWIACTT
jgi:hypothetical protein